MKRMGPLQAGAIILACVGMLIPTPILQAAAVDADSQPQPGGQTAAVVDVALASGGTLRGQVLDGQGNALVQTPVAVQRLGGQTVTTVADRSGRFQVTGLRGGTYRIAARDAAGTFRLWAPKTAPPSARREALVLAGDPQVRGQWGCWGQDRPVLRWLHNPWVVMGLVAAAIAIPVAIHNADDDDGPKSP